MRPIILAGLVLLLAACASPSDRDDAPVVMVVDARGAPMRGVLVVPEPDERGTASAATLTRDERLLRTSDAQGLIHADLDAYYWQSDGCFHFVATRQGYESTTISVSKDLFPTPLRIRMDATGASAKPRSGADLPQASRY